MGITLNGGSIKVVADLNNLDRNTRIGLRRGWDAVGRILVKSIKDEVLRGKKTGRIYKVQRGKSTRKIRASAAGETPANRTGAYRKSMGFQIDGDKSLEFGSREGSAPYSLFLEMGTSRMKPRTGLKNALNAEKTATKKALEDNIQKAIK